MRLFSGASFISIGIYRHFVWGESRSLSLFLCFRRCFPKKRYSSAKLHCQQLFWAWENYSEELKQPPPFQMKQLHFIPLWSIVSFHSTIWSIFISFRYEALRSRAVWWKNEKWESCVCKYSLPTPPWNAHRIVLCTDLRFLVVRKARHLTFSTKTKKAAG